MPVGHAHPPSSHRLGRAPIFGKRTSGPRLPPRCVGSSLGAALRVQFELAGPATDLEEAVTVALEAAVRIASLDDPDRPGFLSNAALALRAFSSRPVPSTIWTSDRPRH